jgi:hypothetical protein
VNLGARGQIYHHDFVNLIEKDEEIEVVEKKRARNGMLYYYVLKKN